MTKLSVYDFDKTIYNGETLNDFYRFYLIKKPWKIYTVIFQLWYFLLYVLKIINLEKLKENFLRFLNGENTGELKKLIREFWKKKESKINLWVKDEILKNKKETEILVAISASPTFLIIDRLRLMGFDVVIGTDFLFESTKFHSHITSKNCKNYEKVKRLDKWAEDNNIQYDIVNFYSDSIADKPLFDLAEHKYWIKKGILKNGMPQKKTLIDKLFWK
ncbi:HAD hydrolase, family IB [Sebaldella termitidis]|jgi:phosphatidylglycerophosphatase C|uniref:Phosphoserine phosphatase-like protein n=1 Tax=Sebaldella termitidis (strain ATCC 33386 / NCTC 11300) TaxID=526218 RepID=D1AP43_SEBTE|nr:HAD-IB family hydrolase [Sebaldella termitidis]ACZ07517.1 Phosphoserine phosphatase-like protein [Sebaldella termitidis ATCC 33386]SUI22812.1 HAD hydrolase, family IB [Sebaldella termitidis]